MYGTTKINMIFIGIMEMPVIVAKLLRPKYTPRIDVVRGVRPPKPIPIRMANSMNMGIVWANSNIPTAIVCRNENANIAHLMGMRSPTTPPISMKAVAAVVCTDTTKPTCTSE